MTERHRLSPCHPCWVELPAWHASLWAPCEVRLLTT